MSLFQSNAVDIFSSGCLIYYILTKGKHPFGDGDMIRQTNIESNSNNVDHNELSVTLQSDNNLSNESNSFVQMISEYQLFIIRNAIDYF